MSDNIHDFFDDNSVWVDTNDVSSQANQPPHPPKSRKAMRKARKNKRNRRITGIAIVLVVLLVLGIGGWYGYKTVLGWKHATESDESLVSDYAGPGEGEINFTVEQGQGAQEIAQNLMSDDIVKSTEAFTSYVSANEVTLFPGTYGLKKHMKASDVAKILSNPENASGIIEVRAGERLSTVIENAAASCDFSKDDFKAVINNSQEAASILPAEAKNHFEGWLQPGVYQVGQYKSAKEILKAMVDARIKQLDALGVPQGSDRERVLTIASIVEAEVNSDDYYGKVSRVIENRLAKDMTLGMDSTVAYGFNTRGTLLTNKQLEDGSNPYNTRVNKGLPPTPISNPDDKAIQAALHPEDGDWLYFVTTNLKTGETKFTASDAEFEKLVHEYKTNNPDAN